MYLLDTNVVIGLLNGRPAEIRQRFRHALDAGEHLTTSSVVLLELWFGVHRSQHTARNTDRLKVFLAGAVEVVPFDERDSHAAGCLRALLEAAGTPIGPYDVLIAGQALRLGATLVTANAAELSRVPGLTWRNWSAPPR